MSVSLAVLAMVGGLRRARLRASSFPPPYNCSALNDHGTHPLSFGPETYRYIYSIIIDLTRLTKWHMHVNVKMEEKTMTTFLVLCEGIMELSSEVIRHALWICMILFFLPNESLNGFSSILFPWPII